MVVGDYQQVTGDDEGRGVVFLVVVELRVDLRGYISGLVESYAKLTGVRSISTACL